MELTRKQKILLAALSCAAALLLIGLILWIALDRTGDPVPAEPPLPSFTAQPKPTETPTPSPSPSPAASPTPYFLPLVPDGTAEPTATASPTPVTEANAAQIRTEARIGTYDAQRKEFLAIGTQNGAAVAVLLVAVQPPAAAVTAIPAETPAPVYTLGPNAEVQRLDLAPIGTACARAVTEREGCWNLVWAVKNLTGCQPPHYLCVDLACMDAFFSFVPSLETDGGTIDAAAFSEILHASGEDRAVRFAEFGVGVVRCLSKVSLWELPAFKSATKGAFSSSLSVLELLSLMRMLKAVETFSVSVYDAAAE
ncbi:MAG: hypothetical protein IKD54_02575 [Clostridia bacterium]|nr:hypothetical protein [Clostridia bacterium]